MLVYDGDYRLVDLEPKNGELRVYARFDPRFAYWCEVEVRRAKLTAVKTCEVCGDEGEPRRGRPTTKTLCEKCFASDRALARGYSERYAEIYLDYLLANDPERPRPEQVDAWLERLEQPL